MEVQMASIEHFQFVSNHDLIESSIKRKTAFVVLENDVVIGTLVYQINSHIHATLVSLSLNHVATMKLFLEELFYWHPYIKYCFLSRMSCIGVDEEVLLGAGFEKTALDYLYTNQKTLEVMKIPLAGMLPEQLSVDIGKVEKAMEWIQTPEDIVVALVQSKEGLLCIDGYSRLMVAMERDFSFVYGYLDSEVDSSFYEVCRQWCIEARILTLIDLRNRIVSEEEHQKIWIDRCQSYLSTKRDDNKTEVSI